MGVKLAILTCKFPTTTTNNDVYKSQITFFDVLMYFDGYAVTIWQIMRKLKIALQAMFYNCEWKQFRS